MFRKSRRKIVAAIMSILVFLWIGTLCIIYGSSYLEVSNRSRKMLDWHVGLYFLAPPSTDAAKSGKTPDTAALPGKTAEPGKIPKPNQAPDLGRPPFEDSPAFQLSTFYSVAISKDGQILKTSNSKTEVYSNEDLENIAREVLEKGNPSGIKGSLIYRMADKGSYTLVAFMDNTIIQESMTTLFQYTLIFGGLAILALYFLAAYLAKRIVQPLEISYQKQKQFISDAGHELKTPVSIISANAELLSRELGPNQWLANIQYENGRMGTLVGQLLELARTEHVAPAMEPINFSRLAGGEALPFESVAFEKGLAFRYEIHRPIQVRGNPPQLRQLISILLDNAIQHSAPKGEVLLKLEARRGHALLTVLNEGDAIPDMQKDQIFERFYRADMARNSMGNHYGLGLAIAKAIVTVHKGTISVSCQDGKVAFTAQFPLL
jgi:signal transduction histidine kinase